MFALRCVGLTLRILVLCGDYSLVFDVVVWFGCGFGMDFSFCCVVTDTFDFRS